MYSFQPSFCTHSLPRTGRPCRHMCASFLLSLGPPRFQPSVHFCQRIWSGGWILLSKSIVTLDNGLKGLGLSLGWVNLLCSSPWASYFTGVCMMVQEYVVKTWRDSKWLPCEGLVSHLGEEAILLVTSCPQSEDKFWWDGPSRF